MSVLHPLPDQARREQPWPNGAGSTVELACGPAPADWRWRLSIARIERDAPFSVLPGVRRQLAPLDAPLALRFPDGREQVLLRLAVARFDGADAPQARLPEGPTRAFNLMLRGTAQGELIARPLNGAMLLPAEPGRRWFAHLLAGRAAVEAGAERAALAPGDSLWIEAPPGGRVRLEGGGELVLAKLEA
ncbi:HutD/Ves family protein [Fulvimonas soli]|jgi:environmental stress-induced protein Ves|uniref:Environmental stress-induced protein Ves n=1 Tax=Fulvimonas soli TaxID=155197 RepID=A0A316II31_9GAMM|nr:HutD family protein [Fulvimonas soli]PWK92114.1 environmental stress-induced protein Ves [Fulvimonas soli]TNY27843.1 hypothetical protein BV497_00940 [Fulvimonas soli]